MIPDGLFYLSKKFFHPRLALPDEDLREPLHAEFFARFVRGFYQPVGVQEKRIPFAQVDAPFLVAVTGEQPQRTACGFQTLQGTVLAQRELSVVSGIDVSESPPLGVKNGHEKSQIEFRRRAGLNFPVESIRQSGKVRLQRQPRPEGRLQVGISRAAGMPLPETSPTSSATSPF